MNGLFSMNLMYSSVRFAHLLCVFNSPSLPHIPFLILWAERFDICDFSQLRSVI